MLNFDDAVVPGFRMSPLYYSINRVELNFILKTKGYSVFSGGKAPHALSPQALWFFGMRPVLEWGV